MNVLSKKTLQDALRLTRGGRLNEAMAALRGAASPAGTADERVSSPLESLRSLGSISDLLPKAAASLSPRLAGLGRGLPLDGLANFEMPGGFAGGGAGESETLPGGARFEARTFRGSAGTRPYKVYVPSGYEGQPLPVVVMLHGCTQSPDDFATGTRMNELAEADTFIVVYPAQTRGANSSGCWNWFKPQDQQRYAGEPAIIAGITREIIAEFGADQNRVYVAGLSAGGAAAAIMGVTHPDLFAAIGVHSGLVCGAASDLPTALAAMRSGAPDSRKRSAPAPLPTIVFHGDRDSTVHPANGEQFVALSETDETYERDIVHGEEAGVSYTKTIRTDASGRPVMEHWVLHGGGHAWSGGNALGSYTNASGPDASREMLRFFRQHRLSDNGAERS